MSYIEKNLSPGERLIGRARISWVIYAQAWLALILFGVFIVGITRPDGSRVTHASWS
ncbi:MAG: hypothetical protein P8Y47_11480 [Alphaproteobacteria bacterium]